MKINKVTITGADDSTSIKWMVETSAKYPFIEWGILVSASQSGYARFPGFAWISRLDNTALIESLQLSLHVCGRWVREICAGDWNSLIDCYGDSLWNFQRVQLNFHAQEHHLDNQAFYESASNISARNEWQLIFQVDGVNVNLARRARKWGIDAVPLYDLSGGTGRLPESWPRQEKGVYSGYAGGLSADNVISALADINQVTRNEDSIWIDMETRVRTPDDLALDCDAVESVLKQVAKSEYL